MSDLLLLEDDSSLGATLQERLKKEGHTVEWCQNLKNAYEQLESRQFDLAILDVGLPDGSGFDLAEAIRKKYKTPFIFMTAASDAENRLQGFELGAEEFIPKPFHLRELLLRVKHVLHDHIEETEVMQLTDQTVDFSSMRVVKKTGQSFTLTQKENKILKILIQHSPNVISREKILDEVWGEDKYPTNRTVDNIILKLRQVLGKEDGACIQSVRGVGYQWIR